MRDGLLAESVHRVDGVERLDVFVDRKTERAQPVERLLVRPQRGTALLHAELVRKERQIARRGDARVLLAQAARRRVPGVGEQPASGFALPTVELLERRERHEDLAPHLEPRRNARPAQLPRDRSYRVDVCGHVFAGVAVTPSGAPHQSAVLVEERDREAVELRLADEAHRIGDHLLDASAPGQQLVTLERIVEREHGDHMAHGSERGRERCADLAQRRVGRSQPGVTLLELLQLANQLVELGVGDLGIVIAEVPLAVITDLRRQLDGTSRHIGRNVVVRTTGRHR